MAAEEIVSFADEATVAAEKPDEGCITATNEKNAQQSYSEQMSSELSYSLA